MGAPKYNQVSIEDYLAGELVTPVKHEFLGGIIYAMAGASNRHNQISGNIHGASHFRLRGKGCRPFNSDTKVKVVMPMQTRFYYPDMMVVCHQSVDSLSYQEQPVVVVEVLSSSTRRLDEGEKRDAYFHVPSLLVYVLVDQEQALLTVWRRGEQGFQAELIAGLEAELELPEVGITIPLSEIYEAIEFSAEPAEEADIRLS